MVVKMFDGKSAVSINIVSTLNNGVDTDADGNDVVLFSGKQEWTNVVSIGDSLHNIKQRIHKAIQVQTEDNEPLAAQFVNDVIAAGWQAVGDNTLQKCHISELGITTLQAVGTDDPETLEIPTKVQSPRKTLVYELAELNSSQKVIGQPKKIKASNELKADADIKADVKYRDYKDAKYVSDMFDPDNIRMKRGVNGTVLRVTLVDTITND